MPSGTEQSNHSIVLVNGQHEFTSYERKGVAIMGFAGILSCSLVLMLLLYIAVMALVSVWGRKRAPGLSFFTRKQIAVFVTCLLVSDLVQSISGITQVKWAMENRIYEGRSCTIQASTLVMGDLGSTVWSCVIAAHTFWGIALGKHWPRWVVWTTVITGWLFVIILTFFVPLAIQTAEKGPFYSIAGTWCFISSKYAVARLVIHYLPLFVAAIVLMIFYGLIFLVLHGKIGKSHCVESISINSVGIGGDGGGAMKNFGLGDTVGRQRIQIAKRLLWYPVAYLACILPISITRLIGLCIDDVPESVWIFGMFFLFSLGTIDSIIYATTRKMINLNLNSFTRPSSHSNAPCSISSSNNTSKRNWDIDPSRKDWEVDVLEIGRKRSDRRVERLGIGGIQVTLESIQEVI